MTIRVLLFGPQAERVGRRSCELELPDGATVAELLEALGLAEPALAPTLPFSRVAVNQAFAAPRDVLRQSDEVALLTAMNGG